MAEPPVAKNSAVAGHEVSDLSPKTVALWAAVLATLIVATLLASYALFHLFSVSLARVRPQPSPLSYSREPPPEPRLSVKSGEELAAMRAEETKILNSYDWVDRDKGVVRIPIARAIEIIAQKGLPARRGDDAGGSGGGRPRRNEAQAASR
jgi:hypothetical protein